MLSTEVTWAAWMLFFYYLRKNKSRSAVFRTLMYISGRRSVSESFDEPSLLVFG